MGRTGSLLALLLAGPAAAAEFYQAVDRNQVGTEDTFRLTVVLSDAPEDAKVGFPSTADFEVLSNAQSTQMSYTLGAGGVGTIKRMQKWTLTMRANRIGALTIPPSTLTGGGKTQKTDAIKMDVVKGRTDKEPQRPQRNVVQTPFGPMPGFPSGDDDDPFNVFPNPKVPRGDSDLFMRASIDKEEAYVGEQVTLTLVIFSRVDLSSVDGVTLPRLDGVWSEDLESANRLIPENRDVNGVPYHAYPVLRRALFAMKPGTVTIGAADADITTGYLFAGHRVHRKSNPLTLKVKPLPPGGPKTSVVGRWRLSAEASQTRVALGEPVTVRVQLEGKGNLKDTAVPPLKGPAALRIYDPTTTDKLTPSKGGLLGKRTQEYVVVAQQTGAFTLPGLSLAFFNPETQKYDETHTDPLAITVTPGQGGATTVTVPGATGTPTAEAQKNRLEATGLKPLRHTGRFVAPRRALHELPWFLALAAAPLGLALGAGLLGLGRRTLGRASPQAHRRQQTRAARRRLAAAEHLLAKARPTDFYSEVEKAVSGFLDARLGQPTAGLTRDQLEAALLAAACPPEVRARIRGVLDTCDMGRFAPGMGEVAARKKALDDAAGAMGAWEP